MGEYRLTLSLTLQCAYITVVYWTFRTGYRHLFSVRFTIFGFSRDIFLMRRDTIMFLSFDSSSTYSRSPIKTLAVITAASLMLMATMAMGKASERIAVVVDQAKVLQLPPNTATIIVGNPMIADVTMINRNQQMILTGKSFGQTNMIALDAKGNSVGESTVVVKGHRHGVVVQRGNGTANLFLPAALPAHGNNRR